MLTATLFTIAKLWNQESLSTDEQRYTYTMEYYSPIKNEVISFAGKWIQLELIQARFRKTKYCMLFLIHRKHITIKGRLFGKRNGTSGKRAREENGGMNMIKAHYIHGNVIMKLRILYN
jgi:hypothetical protein